MNARILLGISVLFIQISPLFAQDASPNQIAENASGKIEQYQQEFKLLEPQFIFAELERLRTVIALKRQGQVLPDLSDDDMLKATAYVMALETKRKLRDPKASYYWARHNASLCGALEASKIVGAVLSECWGDTLDSFKIAYDGGIPRAAFNVGLMYENGWGVAKSSYVAADWYLKAANKFSSDGNRDGALESIEAAIHMVPDHPAANRMRANLQR